MQALHFGVHLLSRNIHSKTVKDIEDIIKVYNLPKECPNPECKRLLNLHMLLPDNSNENEVKEFLSKYESYEKANLKYSLI
jgi:hypothetical protein